QAVAADKQSPGAQEVYLRLGQLYLAQRRFQDAFDNFDKANLIGDTVDGLRGQLTAALALPNYAVALDDVDRLIKLNPDPEITKELTVTRAGLMVQTGKFKDAESLLTDAYIDGLTGEAKALAQLYRGIARLNAQNYQAALADLNASITANE